MHPIERVLARPRSFAWLKAAAKVGYFVLLPAVLVSAFSSQHEIRFWSGLGAVIAAGLVVGEMFARDLYLAVGGCLLLSPFFFGVSLVSISHEARFGAHFWLLIAPFFIIGVVMLIRWVRARRDH